jgi:hypothetical protein
MYTNHITRKMQINTKDVYNYLLQGEQLKRRTSEKLANDLLPSSAALDR